METPTPGLVAYEANPTVTNSNTGAVQNLNPNEYATEAGADFVRDWLNSDPRTSPSGPFTVLPVPQSAEPWVYSVPLRQIAAPNGAQFNAGLWYGLIQEGGADLDQPIAELVADAAQVFTS
jgi:hypothetical protein